MQIHRCTTCGQLNRIGASPSSGEPICGSCKKPLDTSGAPQEVDDATLRDLIARAPVPVVVDFWAPWCGPCRQAAPVLDRLARERAGLVLVVKVNTDAHSGVAGEVGVQGIPTFAAFQRGKETGRQVGMPGAAALERWVDGLIA